MRLLMCIRWHETAPITFILRHLRNQLSFASTSSCQAKYGPIKTLYSRLPNMTQRLDCILLVTFFPPRLIPPQYFVKGKSDFLCDTIGWIACSVLYGSNSFIYFSSIYSRASRLYDRSKTYLKNNRRLDEVYLCLSYLQLPWALTWTQGERGKKRDSTQSIWLICFIFFRFVSSCPSTDALDEPVKSIRKSWKIVSRIAFKVQEDDGRCVE